MSDKPTARTPRWGWKMLLGPSIAVGIVVAVVGFGVVGKVLAQPSPAEVAAAAQDGAKAGAAQAAPTTTQPPTPAYYNFLTCAGNELSGQQDPWCEDVLIWPLTAEARQIIGGVAGIPGALNMDNTRTILRQLNEKFQGVDQCKLYVGVEDWTDPATGRTITNRRTVYDDPTLGKPKLVDCSAKRGPA